MVGGGVGARLAWAQQLGDRLPTATGAVIDEPEQRVVPEGLLPGPGGVFLVQLECAVSSVASRSITTCPSWTGAPAKPHTRSRAAARAALIAASAPSGSSARVAISRDTVGSEATNPNTPASARSTAISQAASPPNATATARSNVIFPGSWTAKGRRHRPNQDDSSRASPLPRAVSTSSVPPACDTNDSPPTTTDNHGLRCLSFTCEVPLNSVRSGSVQLRSNRAEQAPSRI